MLKLSIIKFAIIFFIATIAALLPADAAAERLSWRYYYERGETQARLGMYNEAVLSLINCMDRKPDYYQAANLLGDVYCRLNRKHLAIPWYEKSLALNDRQVEIHNALAEVYEFFSENDRAYGHFMKSVEINPDDERARCRLVRYFLLRGDREGAQRHFEISVREGKSRSGKTLTAAALAASQGDAGKAAALYGKAIDESPCVVEAYLELYELHKARKDFNAAAELLERLKKVKPDFEKAYLLLGYVYFTQKMRGPRKLHIERALENLKMAVALNPDNFDACYSISEIYHYIKKDDEARTWEEKGRQVEERIDGARGPDRRPE